MNSPPAPSRNLEGVSNDESLVSPQPCGNCIDWVLGHVVAARVSCLSLAGAANGQGDERIAPYRRGSEPITAAEAPLDLATSRGTLDDSQHALVPVLAAISDEALAAPIPEHCDGRR